MRYEIDANGCWNFQGPLDQDGYGKITLKGGTFPAHRLIAHITIKPLMKPTEIIAHKCDNRKCINPEHLFVTTALGNVQDRDAKQRGARGEKCYNAKLKTEDVLRIRSLYAEGLSFSKIQKQYPFITIGNVQAILMRKTWKHI